MSNLIITNRLDGVLPEISVQPYLQNFIPEQLRTRLDPVESLPAEISTKIFSYLDQKTLGRCSQVSRSWKQIASDNWLWRKLLKNLLNCEIPPSVDAKALLSKDLKSNDEIVKRIQAFLDKVPLLKNARFKCILGGTQIISIEVKANLASIAPIRPWSEIPLNFDFEEDCSALNGIGDASLTTTAEPQIFQSKQPILTTLEIKHGTQYAEHIYTSRSNFFALTRLRFPNLGERTILEGRIEQLLISKIDRLNARFEKIVMISACFACGVLSILISKSICNRLRG